MPPFSDLLDRVAGRRMILHCLTWLAQTFLWCLLVPQALTAQEASQSTSDKVLTAEELLRLDEVPEELKKLIELGNVGIDFYKRRRPDQQFDGETRFKLNLNYRFRSYVRPVSTDSQQNLTRYGVSIRFRNLKVEVTNEMLLPNYLEGDWNSRLLRHEFDHVRVNTNPRIRELALQLIQTNQRFVMDVAAGTKPTNQHIQEELQERIQRVVDAMTDLVQKQNNLLDSITSHGINSEPLEPNFFRRAYSEDMLEELDFQFLDEVRGFVRSPRYARLALEEIE